MNLILNFLLECKYTSTCSFIRPVCHALETYPRVNHGAKPDLGKTTENMRKKWNGLPRLLRA